MPSGGRCYARADDPALLADIERTEWVGAAVDVVRGDDNVNVVKA